jgi:hypothetical protein
MDRFEPWSRLMNPVRLAGLTPSPHQSPVLTRALAPGLLLASAVALAAPAAAQDLDAVRREMRQMREQYDAELKRMRDAYERRLGELEQRLKATETKAGAAQVRAEDAQRQATQAQRAAEAAPPPPVPAPAAGASALSAFNPGIGVVLDGKFGYFSQNPANYRLPGFQVADEARTPGDRGFSLGESEVNFYANVDQALYGNLTLSIDREGTVGVEEAFFQTTSLPWGFTIKGGRFFSGIGYMNEQHAHVWDFADTALPYRAFLNTQLDDDGLQLRWLAPTDFFLEFGGEVLRGEAFPSATGSKFTGNYDFFAHAGSDIGIESNWRAGVSHLRSRPKDRTTDDGANVFTGHSNLTIVDAVYKWAPDGNPVDTNVKLQGEYFWRDEGGVFNGADYSGTGRGFYVQGVYQFAPRWQVALRYDEVRANNVGDAVLPGSVLDTMGREGHRYSTALSWYTSEFGRFRVQYNLDESRPKTDHQLFLQYTVSLGAHGAHSY